MIISQNRADAKEGSAAWAKPLNPPPPVEGGTGVFFNGHGSGPESGPDLERL